MDRWVTITKKSAAGRARNESKDSTRAALKHSPYARSATPDATTCGTRRKSDEAAVASVKKNGKKPSSAALTKHLLDTLSDSNNPITHSDIYTRTLHITSTATGHQRGERTGYQRRERPSNAAVYVKERSVKLKEQLPQVGTGILKGVRVWIDGYLDDTTDIEMKRIVKLAGGEILYTASGATHILTSQQLSGSKTQKLLTGKSKIKPHVVRPEWVTESAEAGKRLSERKYAITQAMSTPTLETMFAKP